MYGLDLLTLVSFPIATYVKMHLVCNLIFVFLNSFSTLQELHSLLFALKFSFSLQNLYVAFFYCEIDGSSLCLQCDMIVHVGGKRTHGRYLVLRQRVEVCDFVSGSGFLCCYI